MDLKKGCDSVRMLRYAGLARAAMELDARGGYFDQNHTETAWAALCTSDPINQARLRSPIRELKATRTKYNSLR